MFRNFINNSSMNSISRFLLLCVLPVFITAVSVKIDGLIDLGPNWNYKYNLQSFKDDGHSINSYTQFEQRSRSDDKPESFVQLVSGDDIPVNYTDNKISVSVPTEKQMKTKKTTRKKKYSTKTDDIFTNPHKIKHDKANEFLKHIYKQSLTVFDSLKEKLNDYHLRRQIDSLSKNYETKFRKFIVETKNHKIKTHLGSQKVILNAIQVSNTLMNRLLSVTLGNLMKKGLLRNQMAVNIVHKEVNNVIDLEYKHACSKFGVCRTDNTFSNFLTDILTTLLKNDDAKLKVAVDALTETLKNNNFNSVMSDSMTEKFHKGVEDAEMVDIKITRPFLTIVRSILASKHKPMVIMGKVDERVNKTLALLDIIDVFDKSLPGNEINSLEWNDIKNSLNEWSDEKRNDILDIMQTLVDYFNKSIDRMDSNSVQSVTNRLKYFLGQ